jgi:hypothetical protein
MKELAALALILGTAAFSGCLFGRDEIGGREFDTTVRDADTHMKESRTLSALAKLESSVSDYVKAEGKIPAKLDVLVPKYLAEIPAVDIAIRGHRENSGVQYYDASVIRDGQVDGTQLKDSGRWGYVHNDRQVIMFVDCTHQTSKGTLWYQERGVY